jgi:TPR repeat protein
MGMKRTFNTAVAALVFAVSLAGSVAAGPYEDGTAAAERGDYDTAVRLIRPLADQGDSSAEAFLGLLSRNGTAAGRRGDYGTAMRIMRPLADHGDTSAQTFLGHLFRVTIPPDYAAAASWFGKAAERGDAFAQEQLGYHYANGLGVTQDHAAAASWYRKAADQGRADAQASLGRMYVFGLGVPQDYVAAHMWFDLAAAKGNRDAPRERDEIAAQMTPEQVAEAQKLARDWKPK